MKPDQGYSWIMLVGTFASFLCMGGISVSFSFIYPELIPEFNSTHAAMGWVGSIHMSLGHITGIFGCLLVPHMGYRALGMLGGILAASGCVAASFTKSAPAIYLTYGVIAGTGMGFVHLLNQLMALIYFDKYRSAVSGLVKTAISLGGIGCSLVIVPLLDNFGWRGTMLLLGGGLSAQTIVSSMLWNPDMLVEKEKVQPEVSKPLAEQMRWLLSHVAFITFVLSSSCGFIGIFSFKNHLPSRGYTLEISKRQMSIVITASHCGGLLGRISSSFFSNWHHVNNKLGHQMMMSIPMITSGCIMSLSPLIWSFYPLLFHSAIYTFTYGAYMSVHQVLIYEIVGKSFMVVGQGIFMGFSGLAILLSVPFSGWLVDITGSYKLATMIPGLIQLTGGLVSFCCFCSLKTSVNSPPEIKEGNEMKEIEENPIA